MPKGQKRYVKVDGEVIFVDESGNPDLSADSVARYPYYIVGYIYCNNPSQLRSDLKKLLIKAHKKKKYPAALSELKFYLPRSSLRRQGYTHEEINDYAEHLPALRKDAIEIICTDTSGIFAAVLDKNSRNKTTWTSERIGNYVFAQTLFLDIMNHISPRYPPSVLYDRGRLSPAQTKEFKEYLSNKDRYLERMEIKSYKGQIPTLEEQSSHIEPGIWAADIVAGSFECKYQHADPCYADLLKVRYILGGERIYWRSGMNSNELVK
jgi:hypothetical protein